MYQYFKSAFLVAAVASTSVFQSASAAVTHAPLPFYKNLQVDPLGFSVNMSQSGSNETVRFSVQNFSGNRLRCTLRGPDGSVLETIFIKSKSGETNRDYLFNSADEGVYSIEVSDGKEKIVKKIELHRTSSVAKTEFSIQ